MKDIRCVLGRHKFGDWFEAGYHLERVCKRCDKVEAKYPEPLAILIKLGVELLWYQYCYRKWGIHPPPAVPNGRWKDGR